MLRFLVISLTVLTFVLPAFSISGICYQDRFAQAMISAFGLNSFASLPPDTLNWLQNFADKCHGFAKGPKENKFCNTFPSNVKALFLVRMHLGSWSPPELSFIEYEITGSKKVKAKGKEDITLNRSTLNWVPTIYDEGIYQLITDFSKWAKNVVANNNSKLNVTAGSFVHDQFKKKRSGKYKGYFVLGLFALDGHV